MHNRGYSRSIHVDGAHSTIYLAGVASIRELYTNRSLQGDFDGQVRDVFARMNQTLVEQYCGELHDLVAITAFITNGSLSARFQQLRKEIFNDRDFPTSALITIASLANLDMMVEVQSVAVMASRNEEQSIRSNGFIIFMCCFYILQRFS
jgi:enamine deaminase RidA (YjgF/YER057c/UK114 family)